MGCSGRCQMTIVPTVTQARAICIEPPLSTLASWCLAAAIDHDDGGQPQQRQNSATAAALASLRRRSVITAATLCSWRSGIVTARPRRVPFPL